MPKTQADLDELLAYVQRIHERTLRVVKAIPPDKLEWTFAEGRFTLGDLVRHLAGINRYMFVEIAAGHPSRYPGHERSLADGYDRVLQYLTELHQQAMEVLWQFRPEDLDRRCITPDGTSIPVWKWLRAMIEHEIHHRGQMFIYLAMIGAPSPPLFGLTSEEVRARSHPLA